MRLHANASAADDPGMSPTPAPRLVATDLDGTLLGPDGRLSARTLAALDAASEAGITVVAATGRSFRTALPRVAPSPALRQLVCSNGAVLYDRHAATVVEHHPLAPAAVPAALAAIRVGLAGVRFGWESPSGWAWEAAFVASRPVIDDETDAGSVVDALGPPFPPVTKLFAGHPELERDDLVAALAPLVTDGLVVSCSGASFVEITGAGVDKAFGVARLCTRLGVDRHEVVAVGDHLNDVALLRWAGRSVAMGGAHPAALAAAGEVTGSCADDGAAAVLESLIAGART
jgi:hydroxymethylpyrimidine pyrophosphatase-like HAD family hydrolase